MKIIDASYQIEPNLPPAQAIERAARTCYKSEKNTTDTSAEKLVDRLIKSGHYAMLEHGHYIYKLDFDQAYDLDYALHCIEQETGHRPRIIITRQNGIYASGNVRAWMQLITGDKISKYFYARCIDRIFTKNIISDEDFKATNELMFQPVAENELSTFEHYVHARRTVRFIVDIGVAREFTRHRAFAFAQESTRFVDYSLKKNGGELTVIKPCYLDEGTAPYDLWQALCKTAEDIYLQMLHYGNKAQEARAVLPMSTKTELVMTGTLQDWDAFLDQRARGTTGKPHPQAAEVAVPLREEMFPDD